MSSYWGVLAVFILGVGLNSTVQAQDLGLDEINAAIAAFEPPVGAPDPFADPEPSALAGRSFRFREPILMIGAEGGSTVVGWAYDRVAERLSFTLLPDNFQVMTVFMENDDFVISPSNAVTGFSTFHSREQGGTERRSNAYGASVDVTTFHEKTFGVAAVSTTHEPRLPRGARYSFYNHTMSIAPDAARLLTANLQLEVRGRVVEFLPGRTIVCGTNYNEPTLRNPRETLGQTCLLTVIFDSIAIISGATGEELKVWR